MLDESDLVPIGQSLIFENRRVRIWEMTLEPGESWGPHEHEHDYVVVVVEGDRVALDEHRSSSGDAPRYVEADVRAGQTVFLARGGGETAINIGRNRYRDIQIELLTPD
jgi:hypothetical protein